MALATKIGVLARSFSTSVASGQMVKPRIQVFGLEGRYAMALYSAASKKNSLPSVEKDLNEFNALLKTDTPLREFLLNPLLRKDLKREALNSVLAKKKANELTVNLFGLLAENGRLPSLDGVVKAFSTLMAADRGEIVCEVTTAKALDAAVTKELEASLKAFLKKGETLKLSLKVDPAIIGGMIVSLGDKYVDMSISSKVKKYTSLIEAAV